MTPLDDVRLRLLLGRTWRYLRYLHFREAVLLAKPKTILCIGAGQALAELALAIEFPHIRLHVTDVKSERTPNYKAAVALAGRWGVTNIVFGLCDITQPTDFRADLVASIEVLEHIADDLTVAANMRAAGRNVFCLVPFADAVTNCNPEKRRKAWEKHEHFVCGYDSEALCSLFGPPIAMRGCYWLDAGQDLRTRLMGASDEEIRSHTTALMTHAQNDIRHAVPVRTIDAAGIWGLF